ncbi:MAG: PEP-CTERM sorting domain-containing protein [Verrucomicrobiaceae bacterium]
MKNTSFNKGSAALIATLALASLGLSQQASAGIVWLVTHDGSDLTITSSGSLDLTGTSMVFGGAANQAGVNHDSTIFINAPSTRIGNAGTVSGNDPWVSPFIEASSYSGDIFGTSGTWIFYHESGPSSPGVITPVSTMTFDGLSVADAFGTNLDAGPVILWTANSTGDTISVALVPEPSSALLLGLSTISLLLRRSRC